jgi:DNA-binding GntR family transcriptional regulator
VEDNDGPLVLESGINAPVIRQMSCDPLDWTNKKMGGIKPMKVPPLLVEDVTSSLRNAIVSGKLMQGEKLSEPSIQKRFGISRSPIREALKILEQEGLVVILPRRGAYVNETTLDELNDTTIVVATLEGLAARLAFPQLTDKNFKKMDRLVKKMEKEVKEYSINDYTKTHNDFHETFVSPCDNKVLIDLIGKLRRRYVRPWVTSYYFVNNIEDAVSGHLKIIDTLKKGNPKEVENVVKNHIINALINDRDLWEKNMEKGNDKKLFA